MLHPICTMYFTFSIACRFFYLESGIPYQPNSSTTQYIQCNKIPLFCIYHILSLSLSLSHVDYVFDILQEEIQNVGAHTILNLACVPAHSQSSHILLFVCVVIVLVCIEQSIDMQMVVVRVHITLFLRCQALTNVKP